MNRHIKNLTIIISFLFISISSFAQESKIYDQLSEIDGVNAVYISTSMLGKIVVPEVAPIGPDASLSAMYILSSKNSETYSAFKEVESELQKNKRYKTIMKVKQRKERTTFIIKKNKKGVVSEFIMISKDNHGYKIIQMFGEINMKNINIIKRREVL